MRSLPDSLALADMPTGLDDLRSMVQGLLLHREWGLRQVGWDLPSPDGAQR